MIGDAEQYERLTRLYGEFGDKELLALARDMSDLTETAQEVLRAEIAHRRLDLPPQVSGLAADAAVDDTTSRNRFGSVAPEDCVWEFAENEDALAAGEALRAAGIECEVILPSAERFDWRAPRLAVVPEDIARATAILSQPIPEEFKILVRTRDQFVVPICPGCGAADPLLESIEPTNQWRCEVCDRVWLESDPASIA